MQAGARLELARQAYVRAIVAARVEPTRNRWGRLLAAARNLRSALTEVRGGAFTSCARTGALEPAGRLVAFPPPAGPERWPELTQEIRRARATMERSRRLVAESRAICAALAALAALRRAKVPSRPPA